MPGLPREIGKFGKVSGLIFPFTVKGCVFTRSLEEVMGGFAAKMAALAAKTDIHQHFLAGDILKAWL